MNRAATRPPNKKGRSKHMNNTGSPFRLTLEDVERARAERRAFDEQKDRELREQIAQREREAQERERSKEESRQRWLLKLEAEEEEKRKVAEARLEEQLAPERERAMRQWFIDHPGKTEADFIKYAWPQLRQNIVEDRRRELLETEREKMRTSGNYQL